MASESAAILSDAATLDRLSRTDFQRLAELIQGYSGIKMPSSKQTMLEGRLRRRMRALSLPTFEAYCEFLFGEGGVETELVHLIDAVTTNKTEFFREPAHFEFMARKLLPAISDAGRRSVKLWSAATSIGAEPYTLAMVMEEHRRLHSRLDYSILCTDLSTDVLVQAHAGIYPEAMIAPVPMELRQRYLRRARDPDSDQVRVTPALRSQLRFGRLNLMDDRYPVDRDMDMIFCRNILIYFDKPTQAKVLSRLCDHLRPGGHLFLGHSESLVGVDLPVTQIANTVFQKA